MIQYPKSNRKRNILQCLNFVQIVFGFYVLISNNINGIILAITAQLFIHIYVFAQKFGRFICLSNIFIVISYMFHISKIFIENIVGYEYSNWNDGTSNFVYYYSENIVINAMKFYFFSMLLLYFGILQSNRIRIKSGLSNKFYCTNKEVILIGTVLTLIGLGPKLLVIYQKVNARIIGGYLNVYRLNLEGIGGISLFFSVGIAILVYASDKNILRARVLILCAAILEMIAMLSGGRMDSIVFLTIILYIYFDRVEKEKGKIIILGIFLLFLITIIINVVNRTRLGDWSSIDIIDEINKQLRENIFINLFGEMGGSLKSLLYSLINVPNNVKPGNGASYWKSVLMVIPGIQKYVNTEETIYISLMPKNHAMGGSWIGEIYYNFQWFGILFAYVIGRILRKIDIIFHNENEFGAMVSITFLIAAMTYIRSYFNVFRYAVLENIAIVVIFYLVKMLEKKGIYKNEKNYQDN